MTTKSRRGWSAISAAFSCVVLVFLFGAFLLAAPLSPLPDEWNPLEPLDIAAPVTPVTHWKLRRVGNGAQCVSNLAQSGATYLAMDDLEVSELCGITNRVRLSKVGRSELSPVETTCSIALRLAYWERHSIQPAAQAHLGQSVGGLGHFSSYSCRPIRTPQGQARFMSTHATASAIDINSVTTQAGTHLTLLDGWNDPSSGPFWKEIFKGACDWFVTALGPNFNALHADHFHLQSVGWGSCR